MTYHTLDDTFVSDFEFLFVCFDFHSDTLTTVSSFQKLSQTDLTLTLYKYSDSVYSLSTHLNLSENCIKLFLTLFFVFQEKSRFVQRRKYKQTNYQHTSYKQTTSY